MNEGSQTLASRRSNPTVRMSSNRLIFFLNLQAPGRKNSVLLAASVVAKVVQAYRMGHRLHTSMSVDENSAWYLLSSVFLERVGSLYRWCVIFAAGRYSWKVIPNVHFL